METQKFKKGDYVKCSDGSCGIIVSCDLLDSLNCYQYYIDYIGTLDAGYQLEKDLQPHTITTMNGRDIFEGAKWKHEFECPNGYIFKDENGNIINATKIVLEKKKKEYPKTYEECCDTLSVYSSEHASLVAAQLGLPMNTFIRLLVARNAYWKLYGEEMGLGKPWEPVGMQYVFSICRQTNEVVKSGPHYCGSHTFEFPTEEMRDEFEENFGPDIDVCKELL